MRTTVESCVATGSATGSATVFGHVDRFRLVRGTLARADLCCVYYGRTTETGRKRSEPVHPKIVVRQGIG